MYYKIYNGVNNKYLFTSRGSKSGGFSFKQDSHTKCWNHARLMFSSSTGSVGGRNFKHFGLDEDESFADPVFFVHNMLL